MTINHTNELQCKYHLKILEAVICLSLCLLSHPFKLLLLFCLSTELSHFWLSVLHMALYKMLFLDFWFRPRNAQNLLPKICIKSPINQLLWQIDRRCLGLLGGFRGWPIQWNHAKCCGADTCCHGNEIWARRRDPVAYRLVSTAFQYLWWFSQLLSDPGQFLANNLSTLR